MFIQLPGAGIDTASPQLIACRGAQFPSQAYVDCGAGCVACYQDPVSGPYGMGTENAVLAQLSVLRGSAQIRAWSGEGHDEDSVCRGRRIGLYANSGLFIDGLGQPQTVWAVVITDPSCDELLYVSLRESQQDAEAFFEADLAELLDGNCECDLEDLLDPVPPAGDEAP